MEKELIKLKDNWNLVKNPTSEQLAEQRNPYYNYSSPDKMKSTRYEPEQESVWGYTKPKYNPEYKPTDKPGYETAKDLWIAS